MFVKKLITVLFLVLIVCFTGQAQSQEKPVSQVEKDKIYNEEIMPVVLQGGTVDWDRLEKQFEKKYGIVGRELVWKAKPNYYKRAKDWKNMHASLAVFIGKYGTNGMRPSSVNDYAWVIFESVADKIVLDDAAKWSLKIVQENEKDEFLHGYLDTYANILHRLGRTKEAVEWEEKAIRAANDAYKELYRITIDKMKKGEPTWPVTHK